MASLHNNDPVVPALESGRLGGELKSALKIGSITTNH